MLEYKMDKILDLHGNTEQEAYLRMLDFFSDLPKDCKQVTIVHGFRGGQVLKNMVADFKHERIWSKQPSILNPGETRIWVT